ncbi:MAG TPA: hypothetical protein VGN72_22360 [Tepidisphaeraceae bacterium]|nr:hypothetical protein [Tepidisphaeraceae bacterium]
MATTTQRTILSSAKTGTISPQAARKSVAKVARSSMSGRYTVRSYKAASSARKMTRKK